MKNRRLFILLAALLPLFSCGTMNYSAYQGGVQFRNSIYYTPGNRTYTAYEQESEPVANQPQTASVQVHSDTRTVYVGDVNEVDINYEPGTTYTIIDDDDSYAARLRKFDSPTYTVNINFVEPYWWNVDFAWYNSWWGINNRWWYGPNWHWYTPSWYWYSYWHNPWYDSWWGVSHWSWYNHWYDPWWGPVHRPGLKPAPNPGHGPAGGPGYAPGGGRPGRDVYYGKRNANSTYRNPDRGSVAPGKPGNVTGGPQQGSVTRKPSRNQQGSNVKGQQPSKQHQQNVGKNNSSANRNNGGSYTRNSGSSSNRSGSSYSGGSSRSSYSNSGAGRSSGGGSSYRRR